MNTFHNTIANSATLPVALHLSASMPVVLQKMSASMPVALHKCQLAYH